MAGGFARAKMWAGMVPLSWAKTRDLIPIPILVLVQLPCPHTAVLSLCTGNPSLLALFASIQWRKGLGAHQGSC